MRVKRLRRLSLFITLIHKRTSVAYIIYSAEVFIFIFFIFLFLFLSSSSSSSKRGRETKDKERQTQTDISATLYLFSLFATVHTLWPSTTHLTSHYSCPILGDESKMAPAKRKAALEGDAQRKRLQVSAAGPDAGITSNVVYDKSTLLTGYVQKTTL